MKLLVPLVGMFVASGFCCCCGGAGEDWKEELENLSNNGGSTSEDIHTEPTDATEAPSGETPSSTASATTGSSGGSADGLCGRFKTDNMSVPSGFSIFACTTAGGSESLMLQGDSSPKDACASIKTWATGAGWSVTTEANMGDTVSILLKNADKQMSLACTNATGNTTVAMSISQGY